MNKDVKNFTDIYRQIIGAIEKIEQTQQSFDKPLLLSSKAISDTIALIESVNAELNPFVKNFAYIESKKSFSYDDVIVIVRSFHRGLLAIEKIIRALFDCVIAISRNALEREVAQKSETVFHYQRQIIKKSIITEPYKDIVLAIQYVEFTFDKGSSWMMTFPVGIDGLIEKIEKMEVEINFLIEGITIVNKEKEFSYFDIILIMNRFHVGLSRLDAMIQRIKNMLVRAFVSIEKEQEQETLLRQKRQKKKNVISQA
jgi:hypothetical protein